MNELVGNPARTGSFRRLDRKYAAAIIIAHMATIPPTTPPTMVGILAVDGRGVGGGVSGTGCVLVWIELTCDGCCEGAGGVYEEVSGGTGCVSVCIELILPELAKRIRGREIGAVWPWYVNSTLKVVRTV